MNSHNRRRVKFSLKDGGGKKQKKKHEEVKSLTLSLSLCQKDGRNGAVRYSKLIKHYSRGLYMHAGYTTGRGAHVVKNVQRVLH